MKYTKEDIISVASRYTYKHEFKVNEPKMYNFARNYGFLKYITHILKNSERSPKTKEECHQLALKYDKYIEFIKKEPMYNQYAKRKGWIKEITSHMTKNTQWDESKYEETKRLSESFKNKFQFCKEYPNHYYAAYRNGWLKELFPKKTQK